MYYWENKKVHFKDLLRSFADHTYKQKLNSSYDER